MPVFLMLLMLLSGIVATQAHAEDPVYGQTPDQNLNTLDDAIFSACHIGNGGVRIAAECTRVEVPMIPLALRHIDHQTSENTATLSLSVVRIRSGSRSRRADAVTLLAGGPGQSAIETFPGIAFAFRHIMRERDIILIDQRGTGESAALDCPETGDQPQHDNHDEQTQHIVEQVQQCLATLPYDPRYFTSSVAIHDLEAVRQKLQISQWNLYGISYGTRVALHYLRRYPQSVRSLILDAVVPPENALGPDLSPLAQRALAKIFNRCASHPGCDASVESLLPATMQLLDELAEQPRQVTYEEIRSGKQVTRQLTREQLSATLRLLSYSAQTAAILPSMLRQAIDGDLAPLARQSDLQSQMLNESLSSGMHQAVICTEDAPFFTVSDPHTGPFAAYAPGYLGVRSQEIIQAICQIWPTGWIDDDFKTPVHSEQPALILSGGADPITPPEYGAQIAQTLTRARHLINTEQGHMQGPLGCMPVIMAQFIDTLEPASLNTECLSRITATPFFSDANGPLP